MEDSNIISTQAYLELCSEEVKMGRTRKKKRDQRLAWIESMYIKTVLGFAPAICSSVSCSPAMSCKDQENLDRTMRCVLTPWIACEGREQ